MEVNFGYHLLASSSKLKLHTKLKRPKDTWSEQCIAVMIRYEKQPSEEQDDILFKLKNRN